jgi:hypothetical protein
MSLLPAVCRLDRDGDHNQKFISPQQSQGNWKTDIGVYHLNPPEGWQVISHLQTPHNTVSNTNIPQDNLQQAHT